MKTNLCGILAAMGVVLLPLSFSVASEDSSEGQAAAAEAEKPSDASSEEWSKFWYTVYAVDEDGTTYAFKIDASDILWPVVHEEKKLWPLFGCADCKATFAGQFEPLATKCPECGGDHVGLYDPSAQKPISPKRVDIGLLHVVERGKRKIESLIDAYNPKKMKEFVQAKKGQGEGAKVKVYISPSSKDLVIGELGFGTYAELIKEYRGWYGIRYYSRDGGTFYGWIKISEARYVGAKPVQLGVTPVENEHTKARLTLQGSDDEPVAGLPVACEARQDDADDKPQERPHTGSGPDNRNDIATPPGPSCDEGLREDG